MNEPLHPSTLGEILDRTVHLYRSRFLILLGIAFIPTGVMVAMVVVFFLLFALIGPSAAAMPPEMIGIAALVVLGALLVALPLLIALTPLSTAALNRAVAHPWQDEKITIREAYKIARQRGWSYIGLFLLEALIVCVGPVFVLVMLVLLNNCGADRTYRILHLDAAPTLAGLPHLRGGADWRHCCAQAQRLAQPRNQGPHLSALSAGDGAQLPANAGLHQSCIHRDRLNDRCRQSEICANRGHGLDNHRLRRGVRCSGAHQAGLRHRAHALLLRPAHPPGGLRY